MKIPSQMLMLMSIPTQALWYQLGIQAVICLMQVKLTLIITLKPQSLKYDLRLSLPSLSYIAQMSSCVSAQVLAPLKSLNSIRHLPRLQIGLPLSRRCILGRVSQNTHIPSPLATGYQEPPVPVENSLENSGKLYDLHLRGRYMV